MCHCTVTASCAAVRCSSPPDHGQDELTPPQEAPLPQPECHKLPGLRLVLELLGRLALVLAMPTVIKGDPSKEKLTHAAAFKLGDSCTWSEDSRDMMLSVYRSHNASTTDYVCHVAQFCEDSNISQECYCWPYVLEIAGRNVRAALQDGSYPARELKNLVALARCPSAHDAGHCHAQRERLADALMAQLASEPYLQEA